jgi:proteasome lid subunit RPN8/RPN11
LISKLILNRRHWQIMQRLVDQAAPLEACGLLAGKNHRVKKIIGISNQAQSPARFVMNPQEQLEAFNWIDAHSLDLLGIFHSHPAGPETVSATDIAEAAYPVVHIVWSRPNGQWQARGFWIENGSASEVTLVVK